MDTTDSTLASGTLEAVFSNSTKKFVATNVYVLPRSGMRLRGTHSTENFNTTSIDIHFRDRIPGNDSSDLLPPGKYEYPHEHITVEYYGLVNGIAFHATPVEGCVTVVTQGNFNYSGNFAINFTMNNESFEVQCYYNLEG